MTITVLPDEGYALSALTVTDSRGNELKLADKGDGRYTFKMPSSKVTVMMSGYGNGIFGPNNNLSRAQLCQILYNKEGRPAVTYTNIFTDVAEVAWYFDAVTWAAANGIVEGYGNSLFGLDDPITREQLAVMLYRHAQYKGMAAVTLAENLTEFADADKISGYAVQAMNWAVNTGVVGGYEDKTLRPQNNVTRAQVTQMLKNFIRAFSEREVLGGFDPPTSSLLTAKSASVRRVCFRVGQGVGQGTLSANQRGGCPIFSSLCLLSVPSQLQTNLSPYHVF